MKCPYCGGNIEILENAVEQIEYKCPYCDGIVKVESNEPKTKYGAIRKIGKDYLEYRAKDREAKRKAEQEQLKEATKNDKWLILAAIGILLIVLIAGLIISRK